MLDVITLSLFAVVFLLSWLYFNRSQKQRLPPGPRPLPIIGHLHILEHNEKRFKQISKWREQYGDIFTVYYGSHPTIYLCNQRLINKILADNADVTNGRPPWFHHSKVIGREQGDGLIFSPRWKTNRKFAQKALKGFGVGKSSIESNVLEEVSALISKIDKKLGQPIEIHEDINLAVSNIICSIVVGTRYPHDNEFHKNLVERVNYNFAEDVVFTTFNCVPSLVPLVYLLKKEHLLKLRRNVEYFKSYIGEKIREHEESFDPDNIRDFVDLQILMSRSGNSKYGSITANDTRQIIWDIFVAGSETTSTVLRWLILYMINFPKIQENCREEINQVIGTSRLPKMADEGSLVYTEATFLEILRISAIAPTTIPHCAEKTFEVDGFTIPKDAMILPSLYDLHHDVTAWGDPEEFRPERWIDEEGKLIKKHENFMPFGTGRRMCIGDQLAKMELFLFGVSLIQQFHFLPVDPENPPSLESFEHFSIVPRHFDIIAKRN